MTPRKFVLAVQLKLENLADPQLAEPMAAYMKNHFDFLGIKSPVRQAATKQLLMAQKEHVIESARALWKLPKREYQYVACELLTRNAKYLTANEMDDVLDLVVQKSWWDSVDSLHKTVGSLVLRFPKFGRRMDTLSLHKNMWLRRTAIIHQLSFAEQTNAERLLRICLENAHDQEFFIRKAIGWALRQYAHHDPQTVREFLKQHGNTFSGLSRREASKHL